MLSWYNKISIEVKSTQFQSLLKQYLINLALGIPASKIKIVKDSEKDS